MHYRLLIILLLLSFSLPGYSQSAKTADELFVAGDYIQARAQYNALLRKQPANPLYLYRAARCAQELGDYALAEELFIKAGTKYPLRNFFLGEIYYQQWRMPEAIASYEAFLPTIDEQHERWPVVQQRIASARVIERYLKHVSRTEVISTQRLPYAELLSVYTVNKDNGILSLDSLGSRYTTQRGDRRYFSVRTPQSSDSSRTAQTVLVSQQRLLQQWESPDTLDASVNSGTNNVYPFVLPDGMTLYFASDREGGLGGLDIYMTRYNASLGQWMPAENIGMPYNSPADDYLYVADEINGYAYFATNRHCTGSDSVEVYQIALHDRTYLRGLPEDELVALARLDSLIPLLSVEGQQLPETPAVAPTATVSVAADDSIFFVLNDDETYTHLSDFRNDSARSLYMQYIEMEHVQSQAIEMLDSLRHQYYEADTTTRASLQARIPILSDEIDKRKRRIRQTLTRIRTMETAH